MVTTTPWRQRPGTSLCDHILDRGAGRRVDPGGHPPGALQVERGLAAIEATFDARQERFAKRFKTFAGDSERAFCMRTTLVPLVPITIERVHNNESVRPPLHKFQGTIEGKPIELFLPVHGGGIWRPILRGTRRTESSEDIVVELVFRQ